MKRRLQELIESIRIAFEQLRAHVSRSVLTALGVIIGVAAVILMGVAVKGINYGLESSLNMLGTDVFYVEKWPWRDVGDDWPKYRNRPNLKSTYAAELNRIIAETPESALVTAVPNVGTMEEVKREKRSVKGAWVSGTTADYPVLNTSELEHGRFFTEIEALTGQNVAIIGFDIANGLFPEGAEYALEQVIQIRNVRYKVIGVMARQGSFLGLESFDNQVVMPLGALRKFFVGNWWRDSTSIRVLKKADATHAAALDEIIGAMRQVRGLEPGEENDFEINQSDSIAEQLGPLKTGVTLAGFFITGLALFVGAIGIMNVTFVSVKERTREIGTRRALGARRSTVMIQFLIESVSVCMVGGVIGLLVAFGARSVVTRAMPNLHLDFDGSLIALALVVSVVTGILSGLAPAYQAARLDPARALHHE